MLGNPRTKAIRSGKDARTGSLIDMAFDSDYKLQKIAQVQRSTSSGDVSHDILYPHEFMVMGERPTSVSEEITTYYSAPGTREWYCPEGVSSVTVKLWGGGGAGGGMTTDNVAGSGGGGAGGQFVQKTVSVTPGNTYTIVIGDYAVGGTGDGPNGADVTFETNVVVAKGGAGGKSYENGGTAGSGSTAGGVGDIVYKGGNGGVFHTSGGYPAGGEGGGGAGTTGNGGNATGSVYPNPGGAGTSVGGGNGGPGIPISMSGFYGAGSGGGGSAGGNLYTGYTTNRTGGDGGGGKAELTYTVSYTQDKAMVNYRSTYNSVDASELHLNKGTYRISLGDNSNATVDDEAVWSYSMLDPITTPENYMARNLKNYPKMVCGPGFKEHDYEQEVHTYFDTFKVYKTGTLTLNAPKVELNNGDNLADVTTVTFEHNLGYIPMFAPFVDGQTSLELYNQWLGQWYDRNNWTSGVIYALKEVVRNDTTGSTYRCIKSHTASSSNKPETGASWSTYWELVYDAPDLWVTSHSYIIGDIVGAWNDGSFAQYKCTTAHTSGASTRPTDGADWYLYWQWNDPSPVDSDYYGSYTLNDMEDIKYIFGGAEVFDDYVVDFYATDTELVLKLTRTAYDWNGYFPGMFDPYVLKEVDLTVDYTIFYNRADEEISFLTT